MKRILFIGICICCTSGLFANDSTTWNSLLQQLFIEVSHPTNFLYDRTIHVLEEEYFSNECELIADYNKWYYAYDEMYNAAKDTLLLLHPDQVVELAYMHARDTLQLGILDLEFARLKEDALTSDIYFDLSVEEGKLLDRPRARNNNNTAPSDPSAENPYTIHNIFMVSPTLPSTATLNPVFKIGEMSFITDSTLINYIDGNLQLFIDFGNGEGAQEIHLQENPQINVVYPDTGKYIIEASVLLNGNLVKQSSSSLIVNNGLTTEDLDELGVVTRDGANFDGLNVFEYSSTCSYFAHDEKIIFIVSGYNPLSFSQKIGERDALHLYEKYVVDGKLQILLSLGYRIVIVDWENPNDDIRHNAARFRDVLNHYICTATNDEQFVVIGESMGCLVARYTLTRMEDDWQNDCFTGKRHNTRLFISNDGPHQGANIPMSLQCLYGKAFRDGGPLMGFVEFLNSFTKNKLNFRSTLLKGTSVKQMLNAHYSMPSFRAHPSFNEFFEDLESHGNYPRFCKNVALSNGTLDGLNQHVSTNINGSIVEYPEIGRTINDYLLKFNNKFWFQILGLKFSTDIFVNLQTNPEGFGICSELGVTKRRPKLEIGWFYIRIGEDIIDTRDTEYSLILRPYCVSPGGYSGAFENERSGSSTTLYCGIPWVFNLGMQTVLYTDGFGFCIIPVASALDYNTTDLNLNYSGLSNMEIMDNTPFDVIMGRTDYNGISYNENHENLYNPVLLSSDTYEPLYYADNQTNKRLLNAEIGDTDIYLENAELDYTASISVIDNVYLGRAPYYEYPSHDVPSIVHPYVKAVSREEDYIGSEFLQGFYNGDNTDINHAGAYGISMCDLEPSYIKQRRDSSTFETYDTKISIYPTFVSKSAQLIITLPTCEPHSLVLFDIYGNNIYQTAITQQNSTIAIPNNIPNGVYIVQIQSTAGDIYRSKIVVY